MCQLLEKARINSKLESYYAVGKAIGASKELVSRWKTGKSNPNGYYTLKLCELGNIETKEALKLLENGFASVSLLIVTALASTLAISTGAMRIVCILCQIKRELQMRRNTTLQASTH